MNLATKDMKMGYHQGSHSADFFCEFWLFSQPRLTAQIYPFLVFNWENLQIKEDKNWSPAVLFMNHFWLMIEMDLWPLWWSCSKQYIDPVCLKSNCSSKHFIFRKLRSIDNDNAKQTRKTNMKQQLPVLFKGKVRSHSGYKLPKVL